ncbi:hypothetical protein Tco_1045257 [Tanacetum coccineum]|uniref:Uncharacterized protein n=1 Tax=Tanacetum coccineum TaxID=301880 RepID=A0ABQ5GUE9_9ASTR
MARSGMDLKMAKTCYHSHLIPQIGFRCYIYQNGGVIDEAAGLSLDVVVVQAVYFVEAAVLDEPRAADP